VIPPPDEEARTKRALAESRAETDAAHHESDLNTATVVSMIEEFAIQAERIAEGNRNLQAELVESLVAENLVFKRRNRVLVILAGTIAVCCLVLVAGMGFLLYRSLFQTGPLIRETNKAVEATLDARNETIADQEIVIGQAVAAIQQMAQQIVDLGGTPPQIVLDPDRDDPAP